MTTITLMITRIAVMTTNTSLLRLLQLASPTLPVGAYSYSQGLEAAIEAGVVTDATSAERDGDCSNSRGRAGSAMLFRMINNPANRALNALFLANPRDCD